ncbi:MAG: hypothetical protein PHV68_01895 [Candidatus Gastranaerophilales bacterium]|nr:hypothetical protein [Candidatus Gastranaerophilales bacterium]
MEELIRIHPHDYFLVKAETMEKAEINWEIDFCPQEIKLLGRYSYPQEGVKDEYIGEKEDLIFIFRAEAENIGRKYEIKFHQTNSNMPVEIYGPEKVVVEVI